jgi:hypothetical protein
MKDVTGRRVLLVLTDGMDDQSNQSKRDAIIAEAKRQKVPLFMIGLGTGKHIDEPNMRKFAAETNGQYKRTPRPEDLKGIYGDFGKSLRNEYVVEYDSPQPVGDGTGRRVEVTVRDGPHGTRSQAEYKATGSFLGAGESKKETKTEPTPFALVFFPLLLGLGLLFGVPYALTTRRGIPGPAPAPALMTGTPPALERPVVPRPVRPAATPDQCPHCRQYRAPGPPGGRFCMVCEKTF